MPLASFFSSLISFGGFVVSIIYSVLLVFDGLIYTLVTYAYKVFVLLCGLNLGVLEGIASGLINVAEALIMVLVVFKIGVALVNYMLNPENAMKDGTKLVKNILIVAILLIVKDFVFGVFNELNLLIVGNPTAYPLTTLSTVANVTATKDEGLIMRAIFNKNESDQDIGEFLSYSTLAIFIHDYGNPDSSSILNNTVSTKDGYNFHKLPDLANEVGKSVEYTWGLSGLVGLYLIYSLAKTAIEMGIRLFKLLLLQIMAPLAIITCIDGGFESKTFTKYRKKYLAVWAEAMTRMLTMFITVVFVSKFLMNISEFFANINAEKGIIKGLVIVVVIIAAFKFSTTIPKFIDEILDTHMGESSKGGFGKFLGGLAGFGVGTVAGAISGAAGGGLGGALAGLATGGYKGARAGAKGDGIAGWFKGQNEVRKGALSQGQDIAYRGGLGNVIRGNIPIYSGAVRNAQDKEIARHQRAIDKIKAYDTGTAALLKQMGLTSATTGHAGFDAGLDNEKFGDNRDDYKVRARQYHQGYVNAQSKLDRLLAVDTKGMSVAQQNYYTKEIAKARLAVARQIQDSDDKSGKLYDAGRLAAIAADTSGYGKRLQSDANAAIGRAASTTIDIKGDINDEQAAINQVMAQDSYGPMHGKGNNKN